MKRWSALHQSGAPVGLRSTGALCRELSYCLIDCHALKAWAGCSFAPSASTFADDACSHIGTEAPLSTIPNQLHDSCMSGAQTRSAPACPRRPVGQHGAPPVGGLPAAGGGQLALCHSADLPQGQRPANHCFLLCCRRGCQQVGWQGPVVVGIPQGWTCGRLAAGMRPALSPLHSAAFVMPQTGHHRRCRLLQLPCRLKFAAWDLPGCRRHRLCIPYAPPLQVPLPPRLHPAGPEPLPDAGGRHGGRLRGLQ